MFIRKNKIVTTSVIYLIKSLTNEKKYVGSAINFKKRMYTHLFNLQRKKHNRKLQNHVNKYGINDLVFGIIEFCPKEKLIEREQYWIDKLQPEFNLCPTAGNTFGFKFTKEQIIQNKKALKQFWESPAGLLAKENLRKARFNTINPMLGKHHSVNTKLKISRANKGKIWTEEEKQKLKIARAKRIITKETCQKISNSLKGKYGRSGIENPFYGKKHTEESKAKMRKYRLGKIPWNKGIKLQKKYLNIKS